MWLTVDFTDLCIYVYIYTHSTPPSHAVQTLLKYAPAQEGQLRMMDASFCHTSFIRDVLHVIIAPSL